MNGHGGEVDAGDRAGKGASATGGVSIIDRRGRRLVTVRVPVTITDAFGLELEGYTTGINEHGMAGRFDYVQGPWPAEWTGHAVNVVLTLPGRRTAPLVFAGQLLRLEGSWVPDRRYFLSLKFFGADATVVERLREFVTWREDRYFTDERPTRLWYLHAAQSGEQFGPLTTEEVMASHASGGIGIRDQIWLPDTGTWEPFTLSVFRKAAGWSGDDRWAWRRAAGVALVLVALALHGFRAGWLDFREPARVYREAMRQATSGREAMALGHLTEVARMHPGTTWADRANAAAERLQERKNFARDRQLAADRLEEFLAMSEDKKSIAAVRSNVGDCYYKLGQYEAARQWLHSAVELAPTLSRPHYNLGTTYLRLGKPAEAQRWLLRAAELMGTRPEIHVNLGIAYRDQGRRAEADQSFQKALSLQPDNREVKAAIAAARRGL